MSGALQFAFGSGLLYGTRSDIANQTPRRFGILQDVSIDFDGDIKELYGQFQFPVDVARGKTKISGKAKFAALQGSVFNDLFFGQTLQAGQTEFAYNEAGTVPATVVAQLTAAAASGATTLAFAPGTLTGVAGRDVVTTGTAAIPPATTVSAFTSVAVTISAGLTAALSSGATITFTPPAFTLTAANAALVPLHDLGVYYGATALPLTYVTGVPSVGQYAFNSSTGVYTFAAADNAAAMFLNYEFTATTGEKIIVGNPFMGTTPTFRADFTEEFEHQQLVFVLFNCVANKLTFPTRLDDYMIEEFDFMAFSSANGQTAELSYAT